MGEVVALGGIFVVVVVIAAIGVLWAILPAFFRAGGAAEFLEDGEPRTPMEHHLDKEGFWDRDKVKAERVRRARGEG